MRSFVVCGTVVMLAGCGSVLGTLENSADRESQEQITKVDRHSAYPAMRRPYFEQVNILELVDPGRHAKAHFPELWARTEGEHLSSEYRFGRQYDLALGWFAQTSTLTIEEKRQTRNRVQERIVSVSTSRCNVFKTFLRRDQSDKNFILGSLTTASGVLGAVLQGATASRNLAGAAGLFSGLQAEYNQSYFSNLAAQVIVKGIDSRRATTYEKMRRLGQPMSIVDYPMEAAINDAVYYDGLCSTVAGLDEASESIQLANNPGMDAAARVVLRSRFLQKVATEDLDSLSKSELLPKLGINLQDVYTSPVAIATGGKPPATMVTPEDAFRALEAFRSGIDAAIDEKAAAVAEQYVAREKELNAAKAPPPQASRAAALIAPVKTPLRATLIAPLAVDACEKKVAEAAASFAAAAGKVRVTSDAGQKSAAEYELSQQRMAIEQLVARLMLLRELVMLDVSSVSTGLVQKIASATALTSIADSLKDFKIEPKESKGKTCASFV